jgi:hypothetical protein
MACRRGYGERYASIFRSEGEELEMGRGLSVFRRDGGVSGLMA